jgi:hypothetical protein
MVDVKMNPEETGVKKSLLVCLSKDETAKCIGIE